MSGIYWRGEDKGGARKKREEEEGGVLSSVEGITGIVLRD